MALKVYNFRCVNGHTFEAMVESLDAFEKQKKAGLFTCPICDTKDVQRVLTAPHIRVGEKAAEKSESTTVDQMQQAVKAVQELIDRSEFVGDKFAEEARKIHQSQDSDRVITGTPTREEVEELIDEGVDVFPVGPINKKLAN